MKCIDKILLVAPLLLLAVSCGSGGKSGRSGGFDSDVKVSGSDPAPTTTPFGSKIVATEQRSGYQAEIANKLNHFWDSYVLDDRSVMGDEGRVEQSFAAYAKLLGDAAATDARISINELLSASFDADSITFALFSRLFEKYFYNPNSPYLNEELYIPYLRYVIENNKIATENKMREQAHLTMALKNRVGDVSANFKYTPRKGRAAMMHDIEAEYTILYFNNPDCHDCERVMHYFENSELFSMLVLDGTLKILSIYPDPTLDVWRNAKYPSMMIDSYDKKLSITKEELYDLKAIPTLYLLDKDKMVLLKDATVEKIEKLLTNLTQ